MGLPFSIPAALWLATVAAYLFETLEITLWVMGLSGAALLTSIAALFWRPRREGEPRQ